jgi:hypothetical protein
MRKHLGRLRYWAVSRLVHIAAWLNPPDSPWERVHIAVPTAAFGPGSRRQFAYYFEGESSVRVTTIDDIVHWLLQCEYATDPDLFDEKDVWQHPSAFERLRRGDCEDFALWAWRKLSEIGVEAEFYVGRVVLDEPDVDRQHAWVVYRAEGTDFLFEPAARSRNMMIRQMVDVMGAYVPHFAVDRRLRTFAFGGYVLDSDRGRAARRDGAPAESPSLDSTASCDAAGQQHPMTWRL